MRLILYVTLLWSGMAACNSGANTEKINMNFTEIQLTRDASGHCLNTTQVFSRNHEWIVFDGRNHDTLIGSTAEISIVHTQTGEIKKIYQAKNATEWGPGVGAATFSPKDDRVLFIHGIRNAGKENPYSFTRRTGVAVDIEKPLQPIFLDARDVKEPFTSGALRGGTHAHTWSGDGQWISFTYNDYILQQYSGSDTNVEDLRTIGVMLPGRKVIVDQTEDLENNSGEMFTFLAVPVVSNPKPGSNEVKKAFDECWIGTNGYQKPDGTRQQKAIAYQGHVVDEKGNTKTEIFIADIPGDILDTALEEDLRGTNTLRPKVPNRITHRRITFTAKGVSNIPRHWLRSDPDGTKIAFLAPDSNDIIQLFYVSPNNENEQPTQLTNLEFSVQGPFNFSPDGKQIAFVADNSVFITDMADGKSVRLTSRTSDEDRPVGAVNWSNDGNMLAYNRYKKSGEEKYLQIFLLKRTD